MKYVIYARKSTESEDRQTLSIQSQTIEMQEIAKRENLNVVKIFQESKSAKAPGRPVFAEMIEFIRKGKAEGILCWKIDRLARNPMDEGLIKWLLQKETVKQIKTFERDYNPEDNVVHCEH
jgi:site-specific DNA recombinase